MPNRSSRKDANESAYNAIRLATGQDKAEQPKSDKNPAAVALGRLGGLKGGNARASKLSDERKREIGRKGAAARWKKVD